MCVYIHIGSSFSFQDAEFDTLAHTPCIFLECIFLETSCRVAREREESGKMPTPSQWRQGAKRV